MEIKVLGPGCARCKQTADHVKEAVAESGIEADIEKVTDAMQIAGYGVFGTPAVVIDGEVKCVGKIPTKEDVKKWLME
jgi:small redox-active disulfide protein 2